MNILICEDSIEGILTGVYRAYEWHLDPAETELQIGETGNLRLFAEYRHVEPDRYATDKVIHSLREKLGEEVTIDISNALVSADEERANAVYHTIVLAYAGKGRKVMSCLQDDNVRKVSDMSRNVWRETHHLYGFLRFEELESGIMYARINPKNNILTLLAPHFADRFPMENFVIYDEGRKLYVVHPRKEDWYIVGAELGTKLGIEIGTESGTEPGAESGVENENREEYLSGVSNKEATIQALFRHFTATIAIEARRNTDLQRNLLPMRFRPYMTEFRHS